MTVITVQTLTEVVRFEAKPVDDLNSTVHKSKVLAANASGRGADELQVETVKYSDSNLPVVNWSQGRAVGSSPITVVVHPPDSFMALTRSMFARLDITDKKLASLTAPRLRNLAAQILLHAAGAATFTAPSTSTRFSALGDEHPGIQDLAGRMNITPGKLVEQFDCVITRRNLHTHPGSRAALDEEVMEVQQLIFGSEALHKQHKWECSIVENFENIKLAFPFSDGAPS